MRDQGRPESHLVYALPCMAQPGPSVFSVATLLAAGLAAACGSRAGPTATAGSGDAAFGGLAHEILEDHHKRHPSQATDLGIHQYDDQLEDRSPAAIKAESDGLKDFHSKLTAIDPSTLTLTSALDREQLLRSIESGVIALDT